MPGDKKTIRRIGIQRIGKYHTSYRVGIPIEIVRDMKLDIRDKNGQLPQVIFEYDEKNKTIKNVRKV